MEKDKGKVVKSGAAAKPGVMKYALIGIAAVVVIAAALIFYFSYSKGYVAKVGNEKVTTAEFNFFLKQQKTDMLNKAGNPADPNTFWNTKIDGENAIDIARKKALENAQELKLQVIKAKEQKITLEKTDLDNLESGIKQIVTDNGSTIQANKVFKEENGVTLDEFKEIYKSFTLGSKLRDKEMAALNISEGDVETYYNKYPDYFKDSMYRVNAEEAVWARHILINSTSAMSAEDQDKAKKKADDLLARANKGEDFATLAKENTEDPGSAQFGGEYLFGKGRMMPEFENAAFALNPGQISGLVKTDYGYHIIKLEEKIPQGAPVSLRAAKEYHEFGVAGTKTAAFLNTLEQWKKQYEVVKNQVVYDTFK